MPTASTAVQLGAAHLVDRRHSGSAARVLTEADAHGLDKTLLEVDSPALVALADAAHYSGRPEVAARALLAQRQRFADTPPAQAAAFLLGRLADDMGDVAARPGLVSPISVRDAQRTLRGRGAGAEDARRRADLRARRRAQRRW